jgi:DNA-directed RNA polymerase alpha subunit
MKDSVIDIMLNLKNLVVTMEAGELEWIKLQKKKA